MLHKALSSARAMTMHHEYMVHIIQPLAVRRYMGWADRGETLRVLAATYGAAVHYCETEFWGDSSNKASWLIPELAEILPQAKFVHLVRDGRKVASSYFHKLSDECYDDRSTGILARHAARPGENPAPPPEKKYWWPLPRPDDPWKEKFARFGQFERIAWHWAEINRVILAALAQLPAERQYFVRLEDLQDHAESVRGLWRFLELPSDPSAAALFSRPHNVNRPEDKLLDEGQRAQFAAIAAPMMARLGYAERAEYVVKY